ncbi:MAG TPA: hypothetical protein VF615_26570 [Longimicrobiaceae bacterium]|jgi:hypothetical protein
MSAVTTQAIQVGQIIGGKAAPTPATTVLQGYDTFAGSARSTAVTGTPSTPSAAGKLSYTVCYGVDEFYQTIGIDAAVKASSGIGTLDAKIDFARKLAVTTTTVTIVVHCTVAHLQSYTSVKVNEGIDTTDLKRFYEVYGDSFINSVTTGSEYIAAYAFYTQSTEEQNDLNASLQANAIFSGGALSGSLQVSLQNVRKQAKCRQNMQQVVRGIKKFKVPRANKIIDYALEFGTLDADEPAVLDFGTAGYESVAGMPDMGLITANRALLQDARGNAGPVMRQKAALEGIANQIAWLSDSRTGIYAAYGYTGDTALETRARQNRTDTAALTDFISRLAADPTQSHPRPPIPSLSAAKPVPVLGFSVNPGPSYGKASGTSFQDITANQIVDKVKLTSLQLRAKDGVVAALLGSYAMPRGTTPFDHGGRKGTAGHIMSLQPGEFVTTISIVTEDDEITKLRFVTNQGHGLRFPVGFPGEGKGVKTWKADPGQVLIGIQGWYSEDKLTAIQPVTVALKPARWSPLPSGLL